LSWLKIGTNGRGVVIIVKNIRVPKISEGLMVLQEKKYVPWN
jgi:hypothetical protein